MVPFVIKILLAFLSLVPHHHVEGFLMDKGSNSSSGVLSPSTRKRIMSEMRSFARTDKAENDKTGIHVEWDEDNIQKVRALVIGPSSGMYEDGYYLFEIDVPSTYPNVPPEFKFCTGDGSQRMHPNLYEGGKVCLSVLNTWASDDWKPVTTIQQVLLVIGAILDDKPMLNEPGVHDGNPWVRAFNDVAQYENMRLGMIRNIEQTPKGFECFLPLMRKHFYKRYHKTQKRLTDIIGKVDGTSVETYWRKNVRFNVAWMRGELERVYKKIVNDHPDEVGEAEEELKKEREAEEKQKAEAEIVKAETKAATTTAISAATKPLNKPGGVDTSSASSKPDAVISSAGVPPPAHPLGIVLTRHSPPFAETPTGEILDEAPAELDGPVALGGKPAIHAFLLKQPLDDGIIDRFEKPGKSPKRNPESCPVQ